MSPVLQVVVPVAAFALGLFIGSGVGSDQGSLEALVLVNLGVDGESSAVEVHERLNAMGCPIKLGNVYPLLRSLEQRGHLASREVPGGTERGGRPRVLYWLPKLREVGRG